MDPLDPRHGTYAGSIAHYLTKTPTCDPCKDAAATYRRNRRARLYLQRTTALEVDPTGSIRRIRALVALGHTMNTIDARLGWAKGGASRFISGAHKLTHRTTAQRIARVYEELCMAPPPQGTYATRNRNLAARRGWAPPLAWDNIDDPNETPQGIEPNPGAALEIDPIAVQRVLDGDNPKGRLNSLERELVVTKLHSYGLSDAQVAKRAGITSRTVLRIRTRLGLPPNENWRVLSTAPEHNDEDAA